MSKPYSKRPLSERQYQMLSQLHASMLDEGFSQTTNHSNRDGSITVQYRADAVLKGGNRMAGLCWERNRGYSAKITISL